MSNKDRGEAEKAGEAADTPKTETTSTTLTYSHATEQFLIETYPDAIGMSERIRMAIFDARQFRESETGSNNSEDSD
jgi:hypothetical protein